jgi:SLT domain-containing protein
MGGADVAGAVGLAGALGAGIGMFAGMTAIRTAAAAPALTTLGEGGIVTEPTLALIGEKGPEMVTPLDRGAEGIKINIENITVAQEGMSVAEIAEKLGEDIKTKLKRP